MLTLSNVAIWLLDFSYYSESIVAKVSIRKRHINCYHERDFTEGNVVAFNKLTYAVIYYRINGLIFSLLFYFFNRNIVNSHLSIKYLFLLN